MKIPSVEIEDAYELDVRGVSPTDPSVPSTYIPPNHHLNRNAPSRVKGRWMKEENTDRQIQLHRPRTHREKVTIDLQPLRSPPSPQDPLPPPPTSSKTPPPPKATAFFPLPPPTTVSPRAQTRPPDQNTPTPRPSPITPAGKDPCVTSRDGGRTRVGGGGNVGCEG